MPIFAFFRLYCIAVRVARLIGSNLLESWSGSSILKEKNMLGVYGEEFPSYGTVRWWKKEFKFGQTNVSHLALISVYVYISD